MNNQTGKTISDTDLKELLTGYFRECAQAPDSQQCPGEETLADYLGNRLPADAQQALEQHLCQCDPCLEAVIAGAALPEEEGRESIAATPGSAIQRALSCIGAEGTGLLPAFWTRLVAVCRSLVTSLMEIIFFKQPAAAQVRGNRRVISQNLVVIEKKFPEIQLEIEIEKTGARTADIKVRAISPDAGARLDGVRVNILHDSREIASFITAGGEALFENITFGEYTITVQHGEKRLGHLLLAVKES
jgi:hypothetical protein